MPIPNVTQKFEEYSFSEARSHLADIANEVAHAGKRIVLTRRGRGLVAIVSLEDLGVLEAVEDRIDLDDAKKALVDVSENGTISWESIKQKFDR